MLVLGAGVAGLQAIATARRLGAVVEAYDVRPVFFDEVRSMGASFIHLDLEAVEGAGGYAREMTEERAARQRDLRRRSSARATLSSPPQQFPAGLGTPARHHRDGRGHATGLRARRPGCRERRALSSSGPGEDVEHHGVLVHGMRDAASAMPVHASQLYARNLVSLLLLMTADGQVVPDFDDEVVAAACVTRKDAPS